jgi:hypothetical protein
MKKLYFLLVSICLLTSCSSDSTSIAETNPNLLQRVDFYPGLTFERRWFFNSDGLLNEITKADGTIVQNFTYDNQNRLINTTLFNADGTSTISTFTYNSNNSVASINDVVLNYNSALDAFIFGDLTTQYNSIKINSNGLLTYAKSVWIDYDFDGTPIEIFNSELGVIYSENNMTAYFPNESCNYFTYDTNTNPLRNATLAICKAYSFSVTLPWLYVNCISVNNVLEHKYCTEDPESELFNYTFNSNNLPVTQTRDNYYQGVYENTTATINYYYQGDVLP